MTREEQLKSQFLAFHVEHPEVWDEFVRFAGQMRARGYERYSAKAVLERIRWERDVGGDGKSAFKVNNNFAPFYGREYNERHSEFFKCRRQTSAVRPPKRTPETRPKDLHYL